MFAFGIFCKKIVLHVTMIQIGLAILCGLSFSEQANSPADGSGWIVMHSNYFIIYCHPNADLAGIERGLKMRALYFDQSARYGEVTVSEEISLRLDKLFSRVKDMLNMYPNIPRVSIRIFRNRAELNEEYNRIFLQNGDLGAFYVKDYNTIYTSESDIADSVMIHEMAHVIIGHYFTVDPPGKFGEILASYVDQHMEE